MAKANTASRGGEPTSGGKTNTRATAHAGDDDGLSTQGKRITGKIGRHGSSKAKLFGLCREIGKAVVHFAWVAGGVGL